MNTSENEHKIKKQHRKENPNLPDDLNPDFLFSTTRTEILVQIANKDINPREIAKEELAARGLNKEGKWVGFYER
jgi:hypothetical protein